MAASGIPPRVSRLPLDKLRPTGEPVTREAPHVALRGSENETQGAVSHEGNGSFAQKVTPRECQPSATGQLTTPTRDSPWPTPTRSGTPGATPDRHTATSLSSFTSSMESRLGSSQGSGRRGRLQYIVPAETILEGPAHTPDFGSARSLPGSLPGLPVLQMSNESLLANGAITFNENPAMRVQYVVAAVPAEALSNDGFLVTSDAISSWGGRLLGLVFLAAAAACLILLYSPGRLPSKGNGVSGKACFFSLCVFAVLLALVALSFFLRIGTPTALHILRINGSWSLSLHRRGLSSVVRQLEDLEAFVETFGYCSGMKLRFGARTAGHTTSRRGTVHLFFMQSSAGRPLTMSCSLQEPLAFFTKLRDAMITTTHRMSGLVEEYVADFEGVTLDVGTPRSQS